MTRRIEVPEGQRFGQLVVVHEAKKKGGRRRFECRCDCGDVTVVDLSNLRSSHTTTCGCSQHDKAHNRCCITPGERAGRLEYIKESTPHCSPSGQIRRKIECKCDCGNIVAVWLQHFRTGHSKSCGCHRDDVRSATHRTHGWSGTSTYRIWAGIKSRCFDENCRAYVWYGARGVTMCDSWLLFEAFLEDMGERPKGLTIDRVDTNGNYEPGNCRWVTQKEQMRNTRANRLVEYNGHTRCLAEWSEIYSIEASTIRARLERGYSVEEALTLAPRARRSR